MSLEDVLAVFGIVTVLTFLVLALIDWKYNGTKED